MSPVSGSPGQVKYEKMWEEFCFRCGEEGNLLQCDRELCPKAYHPLCVGREAWPADKWVCPWHWCATRGCGEPAAAWCRHCPTAHCAHHAATIQAHPELGALCGEHDEEELQFLVNLVRTQGLEDNLPCPSPTQEQLAVWRRARGDKSKAGSPHALAADTETPRQLGGARRHNRFSVDTPTSAASPLDTPTSGEADVLSKEMNVLKLQATLEQLATAEEGMDSGINKEEYSNFIAKHADSVNKFKIEPSTSGNSH